MINYQEEIHELEKKIDATKSRLPELDSEIFQASQEVTRLTPKGPSYMIPFAPIFLAVFILPGLSSGLYFIFLFALCCVVLPVLIFNALYRDANAAIKRRESLKKDRSSKESMLHEFESQKKRLEGQIKKLQEKDRQAKVILSRAEKAGITNADTPENRAAIFQIAKALCDVHSEAEAVRLFNDAERIQSELKEQEKEKAYYTKLTNARRTENNALSKDAEIAQLCQIHKYAFKLEKDLDRYQGLDSLTQRLIEQSLDEMNYRPVNGSWAVAGGFAQALAGPAAGLAAAANMQAENEKSQIRAAEIRETAKSNYSQFKSNNEQYKCEIQTILNKIAVLKKKVILEDEHFCLDSLSVEVSDYTITAAGNAKVKINVAPKEAVSVLGNPGVIDGSFKVTVTNQDGKSAVGYLNAPGYCETDLKKVGFSQPGISETVYCGEKDGGVFAKGDKLTVQVEPYHLWAIEY